MRDMCTRIWCMQPMWLNSFSFKGEDTPDCCMKCKWLRESFVSRIHPLNVMIKLLRVGNVDVGYVYQNIVHSSHLMEFLQRLERLEPTVGSWSISWFVANECGARRRWEKGRKLLAGCNDKDLLHIPCWNENCCWEEVNLPIDCCPNHQEN